MIFKSKLTTSHGKGKGSLKVIIPKNIANIIGISSGDNVFVDIREVRILTLQCRACQHEFYIEEDEDKICSACGCEDVNEINKESEDVENGI